jgi:hypothetical protein
MKCEICQRGPAKEGITIHRVNKKGVPGIWRCAFHLTHDQEAALDPEVKNIVSIIERDNWKNKP